MFISARFRAHCHATEDEDRVRKALLFVSGADNEDISVDHLEGHHGNEIRVLEINLNKGRRLTEFLERLVEAGLFDRMSREIRMRLDEDCVFHIRLDKQEAYLGSLVLGSGMDCIQVKAKVQAYPARPEKAAKRVKRHVNKLQTRLDKGYAKIQKRRRKETGDG